MTVSRDKYARQGRSAGPRRRTPTPATYLAHRAELFATLGPPLEPGDTVLDLACGDGGLGDFLPGACATSASTRARRWSAAARDAAATSCSAISTTSSRRSRSQATTIFRAIYYAHDRARSSRARRRLHGEEARLRPEPAPVRARRVRADLRAAGFDQFELRPFFVRNAALPRRGRRCLLALERSGPLARLLLRARFTYFARPAAAAKKRSRPSHRVAGWALSRGELASEMKFGST